LLKADVPDTGAGWSNSRIIKALDASVSTVYWVRKQLVEEGFDAVLNRKQRATSSLARIFDGEKEANLLPWLVPNLLRDALDPAAIRLWN